MKFSLGIFFISSLIAVVHCDLHKLEQAAAKAGTQYYATLDVEAAVRDCVDATHEEKTIAKRRIKEAGDTWTEAQAAVIEAKRIAEERQST